MAKATFGGGCFWCLDAVYRELEGVHSVVSGYAGGMTEAPSYEEVCSGTTGHAEVVQLDYDDGVIDYRTLLAVFFTVHDPTTLNRQGADVGTQYRSIILTHDDAQEAEARAFIAELTREEAFDAPIVTEVIPLERFWPGEAYHQDYLTANPRQPYCLAVVRPKLEKFRKKWQARLKA